MAAPTPASKPTGAAGLIPAEWPTQAADTIVETVGKVRDKATTPAIKATRGVVYGLLIAVLGTIAGVLFLITLFRLLNHLPGPIWWCYAVFGVLFSLVGIALLRKANRPVPATV